VASYYCKHTNPVKHITIIPAGNAGGVTVSVPTEDRMGMTRGQMLDDIVYGMGGRVAEQIILEDISTGASNDIKQATARARAMVTKYGMSDILGPVLYGNSGAHDEVFLGRDFSASPDYSEDTAKLIDEEVRRIITDSYKRCESILTEHIDKLHFVAEFLLKNESMDEEQFKAAMELDNPTLEDIEDIAFRKQQKSAEENDVAHENNRKAEEEEKLRREDIEKKFSNGEALTEDELRDLFERKPEDN
jgi:cell division protease FtsH